MELNHPLLRAPFEKVNKSFRLYQKQMAKELAAVNKTIADLYEEQQPAQRMDVDALIVKLGEIADKIKRLKEDAKMKTAAQEQDLEICLKRTRYIQELAAAAQVLDPKRSSASADEELRSSTQNIISNRLIADYLLSRGYLDTSKIIQETKGIDYLVDHELYSECQSIIQELQARNTTPALAWCAQNGSRLRRLQSRLEFRLRLQEFIELVRQQKPFDAIEYAQVYLTPLAMQRDDQQVKDADHAEIEVAMGTLAFRSPEQSGQDRYERLFAVERWTELVDDFKRTFLEVYGIHDPTSLCIALCTGLSTLNTRTCQRNRDANSKAKLTRSHSSMDQDSAHNEGTGEGDNATDGEYPKSKKSRLLAQNDGDDATAKGSIATLSSLSQQNCKHPLFTDASVPICPSCSDVGSELCKGIPFAYHPHSRLVCRITHKVMDEHNPPRVLPNGYVYSQEGIDQMLKLNERSGMIKCVETQELFALTEIKPVYIL
uniref:Macrophage erythroblast attacher n=1 Tax=Globisporangium ultimum (strain ATCC 200006 / CBS 805.95 / DAOM BR144) TaxID=431595 RepID=K3WE88_GLOUD